MNMVRCVWNRVTKNGTNEFIWDLIQKSQKVLFSSNETWLLGLFRQQWQITDAQMWILIFFKWYQYHVNFDIFLMVSILIIHNDSIGAKFTSNTFTPLELVDWLIGRFIFYFFPISKIFDFLLHSIIFPHSSIPTMTENQTSPTDYYLEW